ncbi:MAG: glycosyltransferase family A protein [Planctomycetota bacterium]|nr:glycosyltransferase family A protein [Planctomycetota bacterium]
MSRREFRVNHLARDCLPRTGMATVPKFPTIPQLSILVPLTADTVAFERTLISVLEHRPQHSEVLVAHDGSYHDPYALGDEVRFVTSEHAGLSGLVVAGADAARGRLVHVLAEGLEATSGWTVDASECFEHFDCGSVAPVIRNASTQKILAGGWSDFGGRAGQPRTDLEQRGRTGCYLQASYWRRDLLRRLSKCFHGSNVDQVSDVFQRLNRQAGWKCEVARDSTVLCSSESLPWNHSTFARGMRLGAVSNHFGNGSVINAALSVAANLLRPHQLAEALGGLAAAMTSTDLQTSIDLSYLDDYENEGMIVKMPTRNASRTNRKAA